MKSRTSTFQTFLTLLLTSLGLWAVAQAPAGYYLGRNRIANGDFEQGKEPLDGHYTLERLAANAGAQSLQEGQYSMTDRYKFVPKLQDHSTGTGNLLVVRPSAKNGLLWLQLLPVEPQQKYVFSFWVASITGNTPTHFSFKVKPAPTQHIQLPEKRRVWKKVSYTFETEAEMLQVMIELNLLHKGNDRVLIALDNMSLRQLIPDGEKELPHICCYKKRKARLALLEQSNKSIDSAAVQATASPDLYISPRAPLSKSTGVPPYRPATASATTQEEINCEEVLLLPNIQYHDNTARFKGEIAAKQTLFAIFDYMKAHPSTTLTLYGHTDVFGEEERNLELSKERVVGIQRWLSSKGIQASRIQYEWFGSLHPLHPAGSLENRRVEIKLTCTP